MGVVGIERDLGLRGCVNSFVGTVDLDNHAVAYAFGRVSDNPGDPLAAAYGSLLVRTRNGIVRFSVP